MVAGTGVLASPRPGLRARLRTLYEGEGVVARRFRYAVLVLDGVSLAAIAGLSFLPREGAVTAIEVALGGLLLTETAMRTAASRTPWREALSPMGVADLLAIGSLLAAPWLGWEAGFLRSLRALRLLRSQHLLASLRDDLPVFRRNEEAVRAAIHLIIFVFLMTAVVFETQSGRSESIRNYADALYFTITALTTTGFGDITLPGTTGRLLSVTIMIFGVTLFLRLAQALFRPSKVTFACPTCGLSRHDPDAVHCKACGVILNIPDEGRD